MDKYLYLTRHFWREQLFQLQVSEWNMDMIEQHNTFMATKVLLPDNPINTRGIILHLVDIFVDELNFVNDTYYKVWFSTSFLAHPQNPTLTFKLLEPFTNLFVHSDDEVIKKKYYEEVVLGYIAIYKDDFGEEEPEERSQFKAFLEALAEELSKGGKYVKFHHNDWY